MTTENAIVMGLHCEFVTGGRYMDVDPNTDTKWNKLCCEHRLEMARWGHIVGSLYRGGTGTARARSGYESEELMQGGERNTDSAGLQAEVVRLWGGQPSEHSRGEWVTLVPTLFSS